ncbi:MAG: L-threonylcarbamoyladenylate synthase [Flavitalea sp.]
MTDFEADIEPCLAVLDQGGTILYPTDTVWGIGCDATNEAAVEKVYALKERSLLKSMIVLVAEPKDILQYVASPDPRVFELLEKTTRPTTMIFEGAIGFAQNLIADNGSIGIRIVQDTFCRHLIKRFRKPITSTSANISGDPAPGNFKQVLNHIRTGVDYVVGYRQDDETIAQPSAIYKWNRNGSVTIIRP